jgi:hypothetical protein
VPSVGTVPGDGTRRASGLLLPMFDAAMSNWHRRRRPKAADRAHDTVIDSQVMADIRRCRKLSECVDDGHAASVRGLAI